ncbi:DUF2726 domain-containing protein (plasmid) [Salipiger sp. H15]|uniref:DUF2726 domain-containing protein n=1 Tax=Alloyangia sp. H15 TaxID=3029062 RepID=A0AAU8ATP1_9RHOB
MKSDLLIDLGSLKLPSEQIIALSIISAFLVWHIAKLLRKPHFRPSRQRNPNRNWLQNRHRTSNPERPYFESRDLSNPQAQLEAISKVSFEKRRLLNKAEYEVLQVLDRVVAEGGQMHRIMAQTSLGELIQPRPSSATEQLRKDAHASINSKRLDFAIIDRFGLLTAAVEVQGSGHYHQKTFLRDAVKREALRRAGVELIEVHRSWNKEDIEVQVRRALGSKAPEPST